MSLVVVLLVLSLTDQNRAFNEARATLCSYYPEECPYLQKIAQPTVQFRKRSWVNLRHLILVRGETRQFETPNIWVSRSGGAKKVYARLRHECLHYLVLNSVIPYRAHAWIDRYWTAGT